MPRKLTSFLDSWLEYTKPLPTPYSFRIWTGLGLISSALSRRVWIKANPRLPLCYPNLYLLLVGNPGVGKDIAINIAADLIIKSNAAAGAPVVCIGPESISPKGLIDRLANEKAKQIVRYRDAKLGEILIEIHSLTFLIGELGTALSEYDPKLIPILNDLFNNKSQFVDVIRGMEVEITNPHLTLILGNQPTTLADVFPERAFRMGLTSRIIFIYAEEPVFKDLFYETTDEQMWDQKLEPNLIHDFIDISRMAGPMEPTDEVKNLLNKFNKDRPKQVMGTRYLDYNTRRPLHLQKLCICLAASESSSNVIEAHHFHKALEYLHGVEAKMDKIFDTITTSTGFSHIYEEMINLGQTKEILTHREITSLICRTRPAHDVRNIIDIAIADGILTPVYDEAGAPIKPLRFRISK
jgi:hypothetical protein